MNLEKILLKINKIIRSNSFYGKGFPEFMEIESLMKDSWRNDVNFIPGISNNDSAYFSENEYKFIISLIDKYNRVTRGSNHFIRLYRPKKINRTISDSKLESEIYSWFQLASKGELSYLTLNIEVNRNPKIKESDDLLSFALVFSSHYLFPHYPLSEVIKFFHPGIYHSSTPYKVKHKIIYFDIDQNKLSSVLTCLGNFYKLNYLKYHRNIYNVPGHLLFEFEKLKNLKVLNLAQNSLEELDSRIKHLKNLEELNISNNDLKELPLWIYKFEKLKKLDIRNNQISQLPIEIAELSNLEEIFISGNPISNSVYTKLNWLIPSVKIH